jgi:hypothetical protein
VGTFGVAEATPFQSFNLFKGSQADISYQHSAGNETPGAKG